MSNPIDETYDKIYRYCFYRLRSQAVAEDITQEAFLKHLLNGEKGGTAYLFTIAKNLCIDYFRSVKTETQENDIVQEDFAGRSETAAAVRSALDKLEEYFREVLILRYLSDLTVNETAKIMGISRFAVYRAEKTALDKMKKILGDDFNE